MATVTLTDLDLMDLGMGHTINVLAEDGSEHDLRGADLTAGELARIERGLAVLVESDEGVTLRLTSEGT